MSLKFNYKDVTAGKNLERLAVHQISPTLWVLTSRVVPNRAEKATIPSNYRYYRNDTFQHTAGKRRWFGWLRRSGNAPHVQ